MIEIGTHNVVTMEVTVTRSSVSQWVTVCAYDSNGDRLYEITNFSEDGKAINLKLGSEE